MRDIDFVIPSFNERDNIKQMYLRTKKAFENIKVTNFKLIFVENGSSDDSAEILEKISKKDPRVVGLSLSRNFGPQGAIHAGLSYCNAKYVGIMDGDQQDPPEDAAKMYLEINKNKADVVYAVRKSRDEKFFRKIGFKTFYRVWKTFSNVNVPLDAGEFSVMKKNVVDTILSTNEIHRFNRGLRSWAGFEQIPYYHDRPNRVAGEQKFNIIKDTILGFEALISFSLLPLRLILFTGLILSIISFSLLFINFISIILNYFNSIFLINFLPDGIKTLNLFYLLFQGMTFIFLGVLGEYVGRIYEQVKARPTFIVDKIVGKIS